MKKIFNKTILKILITLGSILLILLFLLKSYKKNGQQANENNNIIIDFEPETPFFNKHTLSDEQSHSGNFSSKVSEKHIYGGGLMDSLHHFNISELDSFSINMWIYPTQENINCVYVVTIENEGGKIFYKAQPVLAPKTNKWNKCTLHYQIPAKKLKNDYILKTYLWNKGNIVAYMDDLEFSFSQKKKKVKIDKTNGNLPSKKNSFDNTHYLDFENIKNDQNISTSLSRSGNISYQLSKKDQFSPSITIPIKSLDYKNIDYAGFRAYFYPTDKNAHAVLVLTVTDKNGKNLERVGVDLKGKNIKLNKWQIINGHTKLKKEYMVPVNTINCYIWNKSNSKILVDDVLLTLRNKYKPREINSVIDLTKGDFSSQYKKNYPPYRKYKLPKQKSYPINKKWKALVNPNDFYSVTGNFTEDDREEIVFIGHHNCFILYRDTIQKVISPDFIPEKSYWCIINTNNTPEYEIIAINNKNIFIYIISNQKNNLKLILKRKISHSFDQNISFVTPMKKYDNNKAIITYKNGYYQILTINNNTPLFSSKKYSDNWNSSKYFYNISYLTENNKITLFTTCKNKKNNSYRYFIHEYHGNNFHLKCQSAWDIGYDTLYPDCQYSLLKSKRGILQLIKYCNHFRNDYKYLELIDNKLMIKGVIEFEGYKHNRNPKYYEKVYMFNGNILNSENKNLILFLSCNNSSYLTNEIQIY